jgi:hypothetical protein
MSGIDTYPKGFHRGRHAGLSVNTIAELLGVHRNTARRLISRKMEWQNKESLDLNDIGEMVYGFRRDIFESGK